MRTQTERLSDAIEGLLPFIIAVVIVAVAYFWFIQAPLSAYLRTRTDAAAFQTRLKLAQDSVARASGKPPVNVRASLDMFEKQMATDDKVADVTSQLAKAVIDSVPADKLRGFVIETSDRITLGRDEGGRSRVSRATASTVGTSPDPRLSLFPYGVTYTPVKVTFSSSFEHIANFMWKVRDFPTTVEVKSATLTRGMPFMKMELLIWVYQRGASTGQEPVPTTGAPGAPAEPAGPAPGPVVPRVARLTGAEG